MIKPYPDSVFKYRPLSPMTLKEILYGEVYFSHIHELNDPYDTRVCFEFEADADRYKRWFKHLMEQMTGKDLSVDFGPLALFLSAKKRYYEELIELISSAIFEDLLSDALFAVKVEGRAHLIYHFIKNLKIYIHKYVGGNVYIASFTKKETEPIMWSHYADQHRGFCLHFSPYKKKLLQNPLKRKVKSISKDGENKRSEGMNFEFQEVEYNNDMIRLDGFMNFPVHIYGYQPKKKLINQFWDNYEKSAKRKYKEWAYEKEVRLIEHSSVFSDDADQDGKKVKKRVERIFYYDQTQLSGIVFGSKMTQDSKDEVISTVKKMRDNLLIDCHSCLPLIIFYNAKLIDDQYEMYIQPMSGLDVMNREFAIDDLDKKRKEFTKYFEIAKSYNGENELLHSHYLR